MGVTIEISGEGTENIASNVSRKITSSGRVSNTFVGYIRHTKLGVEKKFSDTDPSHLQYRMEEQARQWVGEWEVRIRNERNALLDESVANLLKSSIGDGYQFSWESLKKKEKYSVNKPSFSGAEPILEECEPRPNLFDRLVKSRLERKLVEQKKNYETAIKKWKKRKGEYEESKLSWEKDKSNFLDSQDKFNKSIDQLKEDYESGLQKGVEAYFRGALEHDEIPFKYSRKLAIEYKSETKVLILEYVVPDISEIPRVREYKFDRANSEIIEVPYSETQLKQIYDTIVYNLVLRAIYRVFQSDGKAYVEGIVLNGWVNTTNKSTGKTENVSILSIQTSREEFGTRNLRAVDPKDCFRSLKGVAATKLSGISAIPPILTISREDKRFIQSKEVVDKLEMGINVAAMDWEDFEHLVREIFEKEYGEIGGEVKVTQSSRDKGVDAVAFDPDPIRGGKVIIQAKRYTNTVKVESVRALYGIMQDEGAMKGILITTSDYGTDAYTFVKNKPITLLNGNNLLSMLERHGYRARIDLREAKQVLGEF